MEHIFEDLVEGGKTLTVSLGTINTVTLTIRGHRDLATFMVDSDEVPELCKALQTAKRIVQSRP